MYIVLHQSIFVLTHIVLLRQACRLKCEVSFDRRVSESAPARNAILWGKLFKTLLCETESASEAVVMAEASKSGGDGGEELDELLDSIDEMEAERVRRRRSSWLKSVVPIEDGVLLLPTVLF